MHLRKKRTGYRYTTFLIRLIRTKYIPSLQSAPPTHVGGAEYVLIFTYILSIKQSLLNEEVKCCIEACSSGINGVVFNLFSLEGYLIANHFHVPSAAISPFLLSRYISGGIHRFFIDFVYFQSMPPKNFEKRFAREHSFLYSSLMSNSSNCDKSM